MTTVADCLAQGVTLASVTDTPRLDTELLLGAALNKSRTWLFTWPERDVSPAELALFAEFMARRREGEPVAYILGQKEFWSLPLFVDNSTLIPRPDTELLVATIINLDIPKSRILDLGTGTGAIALALASELPNAQVIAVDKYPPAVALAQRNQRSLGLTNVRVVQSNWFAALQGLEFDLIVSNPPYIASSDPHLQRGDVRFEPRSALVAEENGLADIRHIITTSKTYLCAGGSLFLEHGWQQDEEVAKILSREKYQHIRTFKDLGGNDRVTMGRL